MASYSSLREKSMLTIAIKPFQLHIMGFRLMCKLRDANERSNCRANIYESRQDL